MKSKKLSIWRIVLPGLIGNILEWYDFAIYGYLAATLSPLFFPSDDPTLSLIAAFSVFAIGFFMRPLGAIVFGHLGDRYGRKNALSAAILLMAIPTTLIGTLPTYAAAGWIGAVLLIICRLLQGLAVGGEFTGSMVFIIEHAGHDHRHFYGALAMAAGLLGLLIGAMVATLTHWLDLEWFWRIPFLISFIPGFIGLYMRLHMPETPAFLAMEKPQANHAPVRNLLQHHPIALLTGIGVVMLPTAAFYMCFLYQPTYLHYFFQLPMGQSQLINNLGLLLCILCIPLIGLIGDKINQYSLQILAAGSFVILTPLLFVMITSGDWIQLLIANLIFAVQVALCFALIPCILFDLFPTAVRYTGLSLPYNIATALFGGSFPVISTTLIELTGNPNMPAWYLMILAAASLLILLKIRKPAKNMPYAMP